MNVSEIFYSIQGEGRRAGLPCVFVRMQGCRLRCSWCDTPYALSHKTGGSEMTLSTVEQKINGWNCNFVEFTGGEPLEQVEVNDLMSKLCLQGKIVAVETGGHIDISNVPHDVIRIVDVKCPDSRMEPQNRYENLHVLRPHDEVKFVVASRSDYDFSLDIIERYNLHSKVDSILMSPAFGIMDNQQLASWILQDALPVRLQLQIHKYIWHPSQRGV